MASVAVGADACAFKALKLTTFGLSLIDAAPILGAGVIGTLAVASRYGLRFMFTLFKMFVFAFVLFGG